MKAAVLFELNQPLRVISELEIPDLKKGQVKVKLIYSGLCHSQLMEVKGGRGPDKFLPHLLGHEGVGLVEAIGEGVTKVNPGDKVVLGWIRGEGLEAPGGLYSYNGQTINSGGVTTFSEQSIVAENRLVKVPDGFPLKLAVLLGCALPTGAGLVLNEVKPEKGASIAVFGLGGVGLSALIAANLSEPSVLIAVDVEPFKLELAKEMGATHVINSSNTDPVAAIREITSGGADYSVEAAGSVHSIEQAFDSVREKGGLCVFASHPSDDQKIRLSPIEMHKGKQIRGSWGGGSRPDIDIAKLAELYQDKKLPFEKLLSHSYALEDINQALDDLADRKIVRALIEIAPELDL
jgi:S-(hydroxymethyl)glutathione dehydrogenase/alcohol dehydrogenase